jgi:hypothetical protein
MPHLASFRQGWQSENLARFLLSSFAFISQPSTISDDIGSDFFCTLFTMVREYGKDYLIPKNSFVIQIKSDHSLIDVSNKLDHLFNLELPFFVGVVDKSEISMSIFSGEAIPFLFSHHGLPDGLQIRLSYEPVADASDYYAEINRGNFEVLFPLVGSISPNIKRLSDFVDRLEALCTVMHRNIASKNNGEYIFEFPGRETPLVSIFAGKGSNRVFRINFLNRLAEVFSNLEWIHNNIPREFDEDEFVLFDWFYHKLKELYGDFPLQLDGAYFSAKSSVGATREIDFPDDGGASLLLDPMQQTLHKLYRDMPVEKKSLLIDAARNLFID